MDKLSKEERSKNMSLIRSKNTKPEMLVRKWLSSKGLRYRVHYRLPGKPDIVFPSNMVAIFVNGCFWHSHGCKYSTVPSTNKKFWINKLRENKLRDTKTIKELGRLDWNVFVIWQCDLRDKKIFDETMFSILEKMVYRKTASGKPIKNYRPIKGLAR